jgi:hypothetical protein
MIILLRKYTKCHYKMYGEPSCLVPLICQDIFLARFEKPDHHSDEEALSLNATRLAITTITVSVY